MAASSFATARMGMTTPFGPTLILETGPTPGCDQLVGAPPFAAVVTRSR